MSDFRGEYPSTHSPDDVWQAVNTTLLGEVADVVHPGVTVLYEDFGEQGQIQVGTRITYVPAGILDRIPDMARGPLPKDVTLRVEEQTDNTRSRVDVLESEKARGSVRRRVEASDDGSGLLVVEADLSIDILESTVKAMFKSMYGSTPEEVLIRHGIDKPSQRMIENLPAILRTQ
jgi:hypothetical protein